jgi:hypothetical protein
MADNFDLKKFLKESKALENLNPSMKSINEGEAAYEYEKGKKKGEEIEKKKITKEAMKKQIKDMIVAELAEEVTTDNADQDDAALNKDYDPVYEGEPGEEEADMMDAYADGGFLEEGYPEYDDEEDTYDYSNDYYDNEYGDSNDFGDTDEFDGHGGYDIDEAKKKDEDVEDVEVTDTETEDIPAEDEMPAEDAPESTGGIEDIAADMKGTEADLMDHLMKAFQIAKGMQNEKLETQVGNTLKFFVSEYIGGGEQ